MTVQGKAPSSTATPSLTLGCGAGHLSFALAPLVDSMVALDPSRGMLDQVAAEAAARGLGSIETLCSGAESLPFADASVDLVATRYSAHHWTDLDAAMGEIRRVLAPGGHLLVIDLEAPADALTDTYLQAIELLRDRSDLEWRALLRRAGVELLVMQRWSTRLEFASWIARMRTPDAKAAVIRTMLDEAPAEVRAALQVGADGSFSASTGLWWCRRDRQGRAAAA